MRSFACSTGHRPCGRASSSLRLEHYNAVPAGASNVIVRRSVLDAVGCFDSALRSVEDWDLWIRLARHGVPACVPEPLVGCRAHGGLTITRNRRLMLAEIGVIAAAAPRRRRLASSFPLGGMELPARRTTVGSAQSLWPRDRALGTWRRSVDAAVALVYPGIARRRRAGAISDWAREAETWLDALRSAPPVSSRVGSPISDRH